MTQRGAVVAYTAAILAGLVSVAANVAHSFVPPPASAAKAWHPQLGAVLMAAFWPVALLLAIEVLARVDWTPGWRWALLRFGGISPVAAVAAIVSYRHLSSLLLFWGDDPVTAGIGPVAVDGLMLIGTGALLMMSIDSIESTEVDRVELDPAESTQSIESIRELHSIEWTEVDGVDPAPIESIESIGSSRSVAAIESTGGSFTATGSGRVVALVPRAHEPIESSAIEARADDVARIKELVGTGDLEFPIKVEPARKQLRIGAKYVKAAIQEITNSGWTPQIEGQEVIPGT